MTTGLLARALLLALATLAVVSASASAQVVAPLPTIESMPMRFGPLGLAPSIAVTDVGVDDNVFNSATSPESDFTATIAPRLVARLRMRRLLFSYTSHSDLVYFHEYTSERSANATSEGRIDADLGRVQPFAAAGWLSSKQRVNVEVDKRAPRTQRSVLGGTRLLLASRTALVISARREETEWDPGITFNGVELARTLNSRTTSADAGMQLALTPLTTFVLNAGIQRDRFPHAPERDADTFRIVPGLQFDPDSLLRGSVAIGYRRFTPRSADLPPYSGLYAQVGVGYTLLGRTRAEIAFQRDVQYSFEELEPYYLAQGGRVTVTHLLVGGLDVQGLAGRQSMSYRMARNAVESRRDGVDVIGAGIGYHLRERVRLSLNWENTRRESPLDLRQFKKQRVFASLTYGSSLW